MCFYHRVLNKASRELLCEFSFSQFFTIQTDRKPGNNMFIFFLAVNWLTNSFIYAILSLNFGSSALYKSFVLEKKANERASE